MPLTWDREPLEDMDDLLPETDDDALIAEIIAHDVEAAGVVFTDPGEDEDDFDDDDWDDNDEDFDDDFSDLFDDEDEDEDEDDDGYGDEASLPSI